MKRGRIADQDRTFAWHYRVIGYNSLGGVTATRRCQSDADLERVHDEVMSVPGTQTATTVGPLRTRRIETEKERIERKLAHLRRVASGTAR